VTKIAKHTDAVSRTSWVRARVGSWPDISEFTTSHPSDPRPKVKTASRSSGATAATTSGRSIIS